MYKNFTYLFLFIIVNNIICQVPNVLWVKNYDNNKQYDRFKSIKQTQDSNFICCGTSLEDFWLVKVDRNGNILWSKTYGPKVSDLVGHDVIEFNNNFYGIGKYNDEENEPGVLILKYNTNGSFRWMKNYEYYSTGVLGSVSDAAAITSTSDSNFMIVASCFYITSTVGTKDVWLLKLNTQGDTLWTRRFDLGLQYFDTPNDIIETPDSGFVVVGTIEGPYTSPTLYDLFIMKIDKEGNKLWQKIYGGTGWDNGYGIKMTKDNGFIVVGQIGKNYFDYEQDSDVWLLRTDENGDTLWTKTIGSDKTEYGTAIEITEDNGFIFTGTNEKIVTGSRDIWVVRTDSLGDTLWSRTFGDSVLDIGYSICKTFDNGYMIAGYSGSYKSNTYDGYLIRLGPDEPISVKNYANNYVVNKVKLFQNYPNPFNPSTKINYSLAEDGIVKIKIVDILGREIATLVNKYQTKGAYSINFDGGNLPSGVYYYQIKIGEFVQTKKMLLLK